MPRALLVIAWLLVPVRATARADDSHQVHWLKSYREAEKLSRETNKPILVCLSSMQPEPRAPCMELATEIYRHPEFVQVSRHFLCVIGCLDPHEEEQDGERSVCRLYGRISCQEHRACEIEARNTLLQSPTAIAPQHIVVDMAGNIIEQRAYMIYRNELIMLLNAALVRCGASTGLEGAKGTVDALMEQARNERRGFYQRKFFQQVAELETPSAREALIEYLATSDDPTGRACVARVLGRSGDYLVLKPLLEVAEDKDLSVAIAAVESLEVLRLPGATRSLEKLLTTFRKGHDHGKVLRAYAASGHQDADVKKTLLGKAKSGSDHAARAHAVYALHYFTPDSEIDRVLGLALKQRDSAVQGAAVCAIALTFRDSFQEELVELREETEDLLVRDLVYAALPHFEHRERTGEHPCDCELKQKALGLLSQTEGR